MPDQDRIEGSAKNVGGKIKEGVGKMTGDTKLQAEGKADQVEGKVQNAVGGAKDSLRVHTSGRFLNLNPADWMGLLSQRARRGRPLPRGFTRAERLETRSGD